MKIERLKKLVKENQVQLRIQGIHDVSGHDADCSGWTVCHDGCFWSGCGTAHCSIESCALACYGGWCDGSGCPAGGCPRGACPGTEY